MHIIFLDFTAVFNFKERFQKLVGRASKIGNAFQQPLLIGIGTFDIVNYLSHDYSDTLDSLEDIAT